MRIERKHDKEERLDQALEELRDAEHEAREASHRLALKREEVLALLHKERKKSASIDDGGKYYKATVVSPERVEIDEQGLLGALSVEEQEMVSETKVVRRKLEAALERGRIPVTLVEPYLKVKDGKPYIRYTEGVLDDADEAEGPGDGGQ